MSRYFPVWRVVGPALEGAGRRALLPVLGLLGALLVGGCAGLPRAPLRGPVPQNSDPREILAPIHGSGTAELVDLARAEPTAAVQLRHAWLLMRTGSPARAVKELNHVLFSSEPTTSSARALAYYLRAKAHGLMHDEPRADHDRERARSLARNPELISRLQHDEALARSARAAREAARKSAAPRPLTFHTRGSWHARRPLRSHMRRMGKIDRITVHHTGMLAQAGPPEESATTIRAIQKYHMQQKGWGDIGYHLLIDRRGEIWTGRSLRWQGAHAGDPARNRGNLGICLLGDFVSGARGQEPSAAQIHSLRLLLVQMADRYGIPPSRIYTHRELRVTGCPGDRLQHRVEQIRHQLSSLAAKGG